MPITFNATNGQIAFNATDGVIIFISEVPTANPTISNVSLAGSTLSWRVTNNDALTASITTWTDGTPDQFRNIPSGLDWNFSYTYAIPPASFMIYATAEASGKIISETVSYYYEP